MPANVSFHSPVAGPSRLLKRRDSPVLPLQLDLAAFPSVLDRPFVMGQASPYRRPSAEGQLEGIAEEGHDGLDRSDQPAGGGASDRLVQRPWLLTD